MFDPEKIVPIDVWRRIEEKFIPEPNSGCWLWLGACHNQGYAFLKLRSYTIVRVHRYLFCICSGIILEPEDFVCHSCDTECCINPNHMFLGNAKLNNADKQRKMRHNFGERNGRARLTIDQVRNIRESKEDKRLLSALYGVTPEHISAIQRRVNWKYADGIETN
jgi:hypothetical protein